MSLGGEAVRDDLTRRERDLLDEAWIWRAVCVFAHAGSRVHVVIDGRSEQPIVDVGERLYRFPTDRQQFLDDARAIE